MKGSWSLWVSCKRPLKPSLGMKRLMLASDCAGDFPKFWVAGSESRALGGGGGNLGGGGWAGGGGGVKFRV